MAFMRYGGGVKAEKSQKNEQKLMKKRKKKKHKTTVQSKALTWNSVWVETVASRMGKTLMW